MGGGPARDFGRGWAELALFTAINSLPLTASHRKPPFAPFDPLASSSLTSPLRPSTSVVSLIVHHLASFLSEWTRVALPNRAESDPLLPWIDACPIFDGTSSFNICTISGRFVRFCRRTLSAVGLDGLRLSVLSATLLFFRHGLVIELRLVCIRGLCRKNVDGEVRFLFFFSAGKQF